jgi:hypothetical protein
MTAVAVAQSVQLIHSPYVPLAIGFFGLGTGYFVWGGQALFGYPAGNIPETDRSIGLWGIWMPGFMQFITGVYLLIGLTWLNVFNAKGTPDVLYMAAVAFTAYGVHWFVLGYRRYIQSDVMPDAWMAIPFLLLSILGVIVFAYAKDWAVVILFVLLSLIYLSEALVRFGITVPLGARLVAVWQFINGIWLMYLTYAVVLTLATTHAWPF